MTKTESASLLDYETNECLGEATPEQLEASQANDPTGVIAIDADGNVVHPGQYGYENARSVYVS